MYKLVSEWMKRLSAVAMAKRMGGIRMSFRERWWMGGIGRFGESILAMMSDAVYVVNLSLKSGDTLSRRLVQQLVEQCAVRSDQCSLTRESMSNAL